jgi:hypothetical protein
MSPSKPLNFHPEAIQDISMIGSILNCAAHHAAVRPQAPQL